MSSFVQLLARAANTDSAQLPAVISDAPQPVSLASDNDPADCESFDPTNISEVTWTQWRISVVRHGLAHERLGRLAPSLKHMTRVIWNRPLGDYVNSTLAEIRAMKTHGEKRVRAILEVFHSLHVLAAGMGAQEHLVVRIAPRRVNQAEDWIGQALQQPGIPSERDIFENFVAPLLDQIRVDATEQIACLAENRLGIHGPITSVRQAARTIGLTRARVYQLLNEINDIMMVRWPTGRHQSHELRERLLAETADTDKGGEMQQFYAAVELFYPGSRRGADGRWNRPSNGQAPRKMSCSKCRTDERYAARADLCGSAQPSVSTNSICGRMFRSASSISRVPRRSCRRMACTQPQARPAHCTASLVAPNR